MILHLFLFFFLRLFFPLNVFNDVSLCCLSVFVSILHFCVRLYLCICVYHISAPSFKIISSNPLWSESVSLSISAVIGWELGTRQTSRPSFSGTFFISFFFAALFNNHVSFCGYYTSCSSLWALLCIPLSSRWVFLCHFGVIPYLWWFCWVILSFGLFWRVFQCVCRCYSWVLVLMNIFDWVLSSFRFYHYSAVHVLGFIRVSLHAVAKSLSLY